MSDYVMPPDHQKVTMNKQEAYKLLFEQHLAKNYTSKNAILSAHRIISEQTPEEIEAIIEGKTLIDIKPATRAGAGPLIPTLKDVMEDLNKDIASRRPSQTQVPADMGQELPSERPGQPVDKSPMHTIEFK